jgi:phosphopantothenoylcysteine decarboxylase/phosphopantothenate--cysteine ligase
MMRVLLIIGGGIAAYKCLELIRRLRANAAEIPVILTEAGTKFVTPLSVATLSGEQVFSELFDPQNKAAINHIQLARRADLIVVAPATADILAKMANGIANDLATTCLLAAGDTPVAVVPAMNVTMWQHPATRRNVRQLADDGVYFIGPDEGDMACGECGPGRMAEPDEILSFIEQRHAGNALLAGKRVLVTAGPTREAIDPVRFISNRSSGRQGHAIAATAANMGAEVTLVTGPNCLAEPKGVKTVNVETTEEMLKAAEMALPADIAVCAAAVGDWRAADIAAQKIKKTSGGSLRLQMVENADILKAISKKGDRRPGLVIGFAAETENLLANAQKKLHAKGCDWIVANDIAENTGIIGGTENKVHLLDADGMEEWPQMSKQKVAERLLRKAATAITATKL